MSINYPRYTNMGWAPKVRRMNRGRGNRRPTTKGDRSRDHKLFVASEIKNWWTRRVDNHQVFEATGDLTEEGYDYIGELPWPDFVCLTALHIDFQSSTGVTLSKLSFAYEWHKASGIPKGKCITKKLKAEDGSLLFDKGLTFYDISGL